MELTFLGTSAGVPTRRRNVTALALQPEQLRQWILIDCGEGTQHRLLQCPHSVAKLGLILITHLHGDHCYGLPGLLASRAMITLSRENRSLTLIAPSGIKPMLEAIMHYSQLSLDFPLTIIELPDEGGELDWQGHVITAIPLIHNIASFAYRIREPDFPGAFDPVLAQQDGITTGPVYGRLKNRETIITLGNGRTVSGADYCLSDTPGRTVIIGGDNEQPALLKPWLQDAQLLVHEATYTKVVYEKLVVKVQHSTAAKVAQACANTPLPNLVLTHFSPRYLSLSDSRNMPNTRSIDEIEREAKRHFPRTLFLANDLDTFSLNRTGTLTLKKKKND